MIDILGRPGDGSEAYKREHIRKIMNRRKGMDLAGKKLAKKTSVDEENIQELSTALLKRYRNAANGSFNAHDTAAGVDFERAAPIAYKMMRKEPVDDYEKRLFLHARNRHTYHTNQMKKRKAGMDLAQKKIDRK